MDSLAFDGYTSYSDASTPRTPSPTEMHFPHDFKQDIDRTVRNIFPTDDDNSNAVLINPQEQNFWPQSQNHNAGSFNFNSNINSRSSLLSELYEPELHEQSLSPPSETNFQQDNWTQQQQQQQHHQQRTSEYTSTRRATFPYVRHDREDGMPMQHYPPFMQQQQQQYHHQQVMHQQHHQHQDSLTHYPRNDRLYDHGETFIPSMTSSPHSSYNEFEPEHSIKLEDGGAPIMVPSQSPFYRHSSAGSSSGSPGAHMHALNMGYLSPHTGLPVQHTDDAASKETQYLRRRCFNCHTTEPPSWRRSTLNPGKIVCNKCGLYERTHLRPRPLRFDELRAGNKTRKQQNKAGAGAAGGVPANGTTSPKQSKMVKKEMRDFGSGALMRRSSVSSSSSVHSGSGASDWDDNVSIYSSGSAPPTSFNSPLQNPFPLSRDSQSPPHDGGIRLPNNPLSDIASMHVNQSSLQNQNQSQHPTPRKAHTSPGYFSPSLNGTASSSLAGSVHASPAMNHSQLQLSSVDEVAPYLTESTSTTASPLMAEVTVGSS